MGVAILDHRDCFPRLDRLRNINNSMKNNIITLWQTNMAMENLLFEDVCPIGKVDFHCHVSLLEGTMVRKRPLWFYMPYLRLAHLRLALFP